MDDLVKRLHEEANLIYGRHPCGLLCEAADRIEALEAALREIAALNIICASDMAVIALRKWDDGCRAALGEKKDA